MKEKLKKLPVQIAVRAIIFNDEQKIMLIKRALGIYEGGKWCLAGGKPDENESLDKAVARETLEEGIRIGKTGHSLRPQRRIDTILKRKPKLGQGKQI